MSTASQWMPAPTWRHVYTRVPLVCLCLLLVLALGVTRRGATFHEPERSLGAWLAGEGLILEAGQLRWLEPEGGPLTLRSALLLAHRKGELSDVYYVEVRQQRGALLDAWWLTNLTRSSSAAERDLLSVGAQVAFRVEVGNTTDAVVVLDTRGEPERLTKRWPWHAKLQNAITNLQETGNARGLGRRDYQLLKPAQRVEISAKEQRVLMQVDGARVALDMRHAEPKEGAALLRMRSLEKGQPGTITWLVDTLRNVSFVGAEPVAWLEHVVFGLSDRISRAYHRMVGRDDDAHMRDALLVTSAPKPRKNVATPAALPSLAAESLLSAKDPSLNWPPPALKPLLEGKLRGEGEWLPVQDDAFVNAYPNAPPAFYQTFIRVDAERPYLSVYVTLWDPRQVQLHVAMGTAEPESATGETGTGLVPREPALLKRLVGAFNGGFQALHGEFGMMADGRVYLPPKPWAATVAVFADGRVGMGSWPGPGRSGWDEARANAQIPPDLIAMRQNLTSVVEDGRANPWKRWWWGAAPLNAEEQTYIARSGLCLTQEGHLAFLWGETMGPDELAAAMLALRCARGMHLDMNAKHTGLEFYKPLLPNQERQALGRPLADLEFEGPIEQGGGIDFRSRLAVKTMAPLRFPRYLARDPRDFFFLTLKSVLPGPELVLGGSRVGFSCTGLPQAGWPHALARARVDGPSPDAADDVWLVRIDLSRALPAPLAPPELGQTLAHLSGVDLTADSSGPLALYVTQRRGLSTYAIGQPSSDARIVLRGEALGSASASRAIGLDAEGFLLYGQCAAGNSAALANALREAGVQVALALPDASQLSFATAAGAVSVDGKQKLEPSGGLSFMAETRAAAQVLFPDIKPMPYQRWGWLQGQRVRYFPSGPPRFPTPETVNYREGHATLPPVGQSPSGPTLPRGSLRSPPP